jgi:heat shock protein HtpX
MPNYRPPIDLARQRARRRRNALQTTLLLVGMTLLMAAIGWLVGGPIGLLWIGAFGAFSLWIGSRVSPRLVLGFFQATELSRAELPQVYDVVEVLSRRAGLPKPPKLYFISSQLTNAFTVGRRDDAALAITSGTLRALSLRELAGVLAHEISHLANNDTRVMALADVVSRLTRAMSLAGMVLFIGNLPLMMMGQARFSWLLILLLVFAPTVGTLLQLALSRTREYDADMEAAALTGDPAGLASALRKLERHQGAMWEEILLPGRRIPDPSILRTHPDTEERVRRLMELRTPEAPPLPLPEDHFGHHGSVPEVRRPPRWRRTGTWF